MKPKTKPKALPVVFRTASRYMHYDPWFEHRREPLGTDIEKAAFIAQDVAATYATDPYGLRTFVVQSSVDGGKTWQLQRTIQGTQIDETKPTRR